MDNLSALSKKRLLTFFQALADPIRLDIFLCLLEEKQRRVTEIKYHISKSTLSHHIKVLKDAKLIAVQKEGTTHIYSIHPDFKANRELLFTVLKGREETLYEE